MLLLGILASSALLSLQLWVFSWAPPNGYRPPRGMWWEFACMLPFAIIVAIREFADGTVFAANPSLWWSAPAISLFAAFSLLLYLVASRLLSMNLFGLLSYVEPALLVVASLLIGERIAPGEWFTYGAIWVAVLMLVAGGVVGLHRRRLR